MSTPVGANGENFAYPTDQEVGYASQATGWAQAVTAALDAIGRGRSVSVNPKAVVDMVSTSKGLLIPRMTTVQISAISSPPESLLVYDTTQRVFKYYRDSAWVSVGSFVEGNFDVNGDLDVSGTGAFGSALSALSLAITNAITAASATLTGAFQALTGNFTDATDATNADTAPLKTLGGMAVKKKLFVGGNFSGTTGYFADTTDATSSTDGALKMAGGVGIAKKLFVGGVTYLDDDTTANTPVLSFTGDTNTGIGRSAAYTLDFITNGNSRFRIESTGQIKAVYESQVGTDYNTQLDNGYFCRAWVNFNGTATQRTGTYTISGTTITVNITSHGLATGNFAQLDFASGDGVDGRYQVTVINANSYTVTNPVSGSTGGNVTQDAMIRASGNVSSITDNGTGDYTVNFTTAMPDANYSTVYGGQFDTSGSGAAFAIFGLSRTASPQTVNGVRIITGNSTLTDIPIVNVAVFR